MIYAEPIRRFVVGELRVKKSPGRPPKVGHLSRDDWSEILSRTPNQYESVLLV